MAAKFLLKTGTSCYNTLEFMIPYAKEIHTIELSEKLHKKNLKDLKTMILYTVIMVRVKI